ncbi:MAG: dihydrofolate reductase family protein [Candidatus Dormibacteraceae bacterium]
MRPLEVLYERPGLPAYDLPPELARLYGGSLGFSPPRVYANFVSSLDGVVALDEPGVPSGPAISGRSEADRLVMGLLRACAEVVLVGAGTVRDDSGHLWTPEYIHPAGAAAFAALRESLGLAPRPRLAVLTARGDIDLRERALTEGALILTSHAGGARLRPLLPAASEVVTLPDGPRVSIGAALAALRDRGHRVILTEGGPHVLGQLLRERALDELFLTLSPVLAGHRAGRLGLAEDVELLPGAPNWGTLASLRREGSHIFCRYQLGGDSPPPS